MSSKLIVDLKKIGANLNVVNEIVGQNVQIMAVVKDEAYGHGLIKVASYLQDKTDWFCVSNIDEAVRLREHQINNPILVFGVPEKGKEFLYKKHQITASISDLSVFERLKPGTNCHIHFDTGMHRLGILPEDLEKVQNKMKACSELNYSGIYTHFANADDPGHSRVLQQLNTFKEIRQEFPENWMAHTANSGAIFHYQMEGVLMDAVRPGVCLYGFAPGEIDIPKLTPAAEWKSQIIQVRKAKKGEKVGYGSRWEVPHDGWLAILPVGYADGIFRNLSNQIMVEIRGKKYPQAGTVSMDYIAVFLKNDLYQEGEEVTILGEGDISASYWAKKMGTIPYEITTSIAPKVKRVYLD